MTGSLAKTLSDFATRTDIPSIPAHVLEAARWHLIDTIGVCLASARPGEGSHAVARKLADTWAGDEGARVIGFGVRCRTDQSALLNGLLAQALEMDDKHGPSLARPGSTIVPAVLAVSEARDLTVGEALRAIVIGYEAMIRLGLVAGDQFLARGYHTSALLGAFGAAIAIGALTAMPSEQIENALGIAGTMTAGIQEATRTGSTSKMIHGGWAAHSGILAAELAGGGVTGPSSVFEGDYGFFLTHLGTDDVELHWDRATSRLGEHWHLLDTAYKPYPCCQLLHSFIDAAFQLRAQIAADGLSPSDISHVHGRLAEPGLSLVTQPLNRKKAPASSHEARFSLPFVVAWSLVHGTLGVESFTDEALSDVRVLDLAARTSTAEDPLSDYPLHNPADLRLTAGDKEYAIRVDFHPGCPEAPFSISDVTAKFARNTNWRWGDDAADMAGELFSMDDRSPVRAMLDLVTDPKPRRGI